MDYLSRAAATLAEMQRIRQEMESLRRSQVALLAGIRETQEEVSHLNALVRENADRVEALSIDEDSDSDSAISLSEDYTPSSSEGNLYTPRRSPSIVSEAWTDDSLYFAHPTNLTSRRNSTNTISSSWTDDSLYFASPSRRHSANISDTWTDDSLYLAVPTPSSPTDTSPLTHAPASPREAEEMEIAENSENIPPGMSDARYLQLTAERYWTQAVRSVRARREGQWAQGPVLGEIRNGAKPKRILQREREAPIPELEVRIFGGSEEEERERLRRERERDQEGGDENQEN